ncbi:MAG: AIR synthase related protein, partial [Candidatus Micrarchaeales archaeon]
MDKNSRAKPNASRDITYAESGVDRNIRDKSKSSLSSLQETYRHSEYGSILRLPYGNLTPLDKHGKRYLDHKIEGIGTKVLVAQLADRYDTMPIEGLAMAVNDVIRSGAKPFSAADNIDAEKSDPKLVAQWMKGFVDAANMANVPIVDGEIADVAALIRGVKVGSGHHIVCSCVGFVDKEHIIWGTGLLPGDVIIGIRSSGVHSNGISLVRKVLFKEWGGYYDDPFARVNGLDTDLISEVLKPTVIYSNALLKVNETQFVKAAVHVTGDAHMKFDKLFASNPEIGFVFDALRPQPIFDVIQQTAEKLGRTITDEEMLKTFNMGDG